MVPFWAFGSSHFYILPLIHTWDICPLYYNDPLHFTFSLDIPSYLQAHDLPSQ